MHHLNVTVGLETLFAPFAANATFFVATEERCRYRFLKRVDKDRASVQSPADRLGALNILTPDTGPKPCVGSVCAVDDFFLIIPWLNWHDGTEGLLRNDPAIVWRIVNDGGLDKEALGGLDIRRSSGEVVAAGLLIVIVNDAITDEM